jgi:peroxiredoxin Q/BCP
MKLLPTKSRAVVLVWGALISAMWFGQTVAAEIDVGDPAPSFTCTDDTGKSWNSGEHFGRKITVVYFYPAALTGGCTKQACGFRDDMKSLTERGVEVVGVSGDEVPGLQLFKQVHDLNFTLLADTDGSVAQKFGVPLRPGGAITQTVDGKEHVLKRGVTAARWTFVVDKSGKIAVKNSQVNAAEDSKAILALVEKLDQK